MNTRVDLILHTEQRSATLISMKLILRVMTFAVPAAIILVLLSQYLGMRRLESQVVRIEKKLEQSDPESKRARDLMAEFQQNRAILQEIKAWRNAHFEWHLQLAGLMREVPSNVQLQQLRVDQTLELIKDTTAARRFTLSLRGRATGNQAEQAVQDVQQRLMSAPAFSSWMETVEIPQGSYGADTTPGASRSDRVFQMSCRYKERLFK